MFNGIINHTGKVKKIYKKNNNCLLEIFSKINFKKNEIGSSVSCSGACLTLDRIRKNVPQTSVRAWVFANVPKRRNIDGVERGFRKDFIAPQCSSIRAIASPTNR